MRRKMTAPFLAVLALCGLLGTVRACAPSKNHVITVGSNTYVCVVINWKSYLVAVPKADEYSRIAIAGSYMDNNSTFAYGYNRQNCSQENAYNFGADKDLGLCQYTTVTIESQGVKSLTKAYKIFQGGEYSSSTAPVYVFPIMTAVISVYNGKVQSITWDDGCYFCDTLTANADGENEYCQPNIFSTPNASALPSSSLANAQRAAAEQARPYSAEQLEAAKVDGAGMSCITYGAGASQENPSVTGTAPLNCAETPSECDLKLYVVWTGTDSNGNYFQSAGLRFSRFQQFAISSLYTSARTLALDAYDATSSTVEAGVDAVKSRL